MARPCLAVISRLDTARQIDLPCRLRRRCSITHSPDSGAAHALVGRCIIAIAAMPGRPAGRPAALTLVVPGDVLKRQRWGSQAAGGKFSGAGSTAQSRPAHFPAHFVTASLAITQSEMLGEGHMSKLGWGRRYSSRRSGEGIMSAGGQDSGTHAMLTGRAARKVCPRAEGVTRLALDDPTRPHPRGSWPRGPTASQRMRGRLIESTVQQNVTKRI